MTNAWGRYGESTRCTTNGTELVAGRTRCRGVVASVKPPYLRGSSDRARTAGPLALPWTAQAEGVGIEHGSYAGSRSSSALPLSMSMGTDTCSWVMSQRPSSLRKQAVQRTHMLVVCPLVMVPLIWLRL
jgi:hypothetical protein